MICERPRAVVPDQECRCHRPQSGRWRR